MWKKLIAGALLVLLFYTSLMVYMKMQEQDYRIQMLQTTVKHKDIAIRNLNKIMCKQAKELEIVGKRTE